MFFFILGIFIGLCASLAQLFRGGFVTLTFGRARREPPLLQWPAVPELTPSLPAIDASEPEPVADSTWKKEIPKL